MVTLRKNWPFIFTLLVIFVDFLVINLSFLSAIYLRFPNFQDPFQYSMPWIFVNLAFFPLAMVLGLYRGIFRTSLENQKAYLRRFTYYLALFTMSYLFMIKGHQFSRGVVIIFIMVQYIALEVVHGILYRFNRWLARKGFGSHRTLIVGSDTSALRFFENLQDNYGDFYRVKGFLTNGRPTKVDPAITPYILGDYNTIEDVLEKHHIDQVFIVSDSMLQKKYEPIRQVCGRRNVQVKMVSPFIKNLMRQIRVKDITGVPLVLLEDRPRFQAYQARLKRFLDLLVLLLASIVLVPVCLFIAGLIKLTSRGPVFFKQKRALYKGGPEFWFYKFRTMYENADEIKEKYLAQNEANGALFKMKRDPRVTPVGRWLRKYSLDELPQFINVLKGEMSIVGPRPLPVKDFDLIRNGKMNYDWYKLRGRTKPGITGLWQISGRSNLSFEEMCMLDLYYIENQSIFFDLEIMFETIPVMFTGRGAY